MYYYYKEINFQVLLNQILISLHHIQHYYINYPIKVQINHQMKYLILGSSKFFIIFILNIILINNFNYIITIFSIIEFTYLL